MSNVPIVSYIVLNWRNEAQTLGCLHSISAQAGGVAHEVIVVDNQSTIGSRVALDAPGRRIVAHARNTGYAGGMNSGVAISRGRFVALINNDVRLGPDWTAQALAGMDDPRVAVVGGRDDESTIPVVDPRGFPVLSSCEVPRMSVPTVDGAHLLIRRDAFGGIGGFDEDFFAYFDELDLCARLSARGWQVIYDPLLRVSHVRGASSSRTPWRRTFFSRRNRTIWIAKHFPAGEWRAAVWAAATEYLAEAVNPPSEATARWQLSRRAAAIVGFAWVVTHGRWLRAKRRQTIAAGQHSDGYRAGLAVALQELEPYLTAGGRAQ